MMMIKGSTATSTTMTQRDMATLTTEDQETKKAKEDPAIAIKMNIGIEDPGMVTETRIGTRDPNMTGGDLVMVTETRDLTMMCVTETDGHPQPGGGTLTATTRTPVP